MAQKKYKFVHGWKPDLPDHRDRHYKITAPVDIPDKFDLKSIMPPVYDQGRLGSCTANAIAGAIESVFHASKQIDFTPSRLFIYYNERALEGTIQSDAGAEIRDGIKTVARQGVCPEPMWPYEIAKFTTKPKKACYDDGAKNIALLYERVAQDPNVIEQLIAGGRPIIFGFSVYTAFEGPAVAKTGILNLPEPHETLLGGHAVLCVGYDRPNQRFLIRNSWGPKWGQQGYFTMPYDYLCNPKLADDLWCIETMKDVG